MAEVGFKLDVVGGDLVVTAGDSEVGDEEPELRDGARPGLTPIPDPEVVLNETLLALLLDAAESDRERFLFRILDRNFWALPSPFSLAGGGPALVPANGPDRITREDEASFVLVEFGVAVPDPPLLPIVCSCIFF